MKKVTLYLYTKKEFLMNNVGLNFRGIEQPTINAEKKVDEKPIEKPIEEDVKPQEFSKEASDALRASVLYKKPELQTVDDTAEKVDDIKVDENKTNDFEKTVGDIEKEVNIENKADEKSTEMKEYIPNDATPQEVRDTLADKSKVGRSFFGYKKYLKNKVKDSNEPQTAIANLNYLLNADDGKLSAKEISTIMNITEIVNNNKDEKLSKKYSEVFGFDGGKLDDSSYDKISKKMQEQRMVELTLGSAMAMEGLRQQQQQMQNDIMNQQIMINQQTIDNINQQMINQQMMQPPMGF